MAAARRLVSWLWLCHRMTVIWSAPAGAQAHGAPSTAVRERVEEQLKKRRQRR